MNAPVNDDKEKSNEPEKSEREEISFERAVSMLPDGDQIHTFRQAGGPGLILVGADWERSALIDLMRLSQVELSGPAATEMRHGMVLKDRWGHLFIATKEVA